MLTALVQLIINFLNWIFKNKKENADDIKLREDVELADAIKRGDSETVSAIREKRRHYPSATILLLCVCFLFIGCGSTRPRKTIPLATGVAPYQLPTGNYVDTKGEIHIETTNRWSISEQDLFSKSSVEELKPETDKTIKFWRKYGDCIVIFMILFTTIGLCFLISRIISKI